MKVRYVALMAVITALGTRPCVADVQKVSIGQASQEQAAEAVAHYARSRALLIAALNEFDLARKLARPDELIDPVKWRNTLIDRAEDLERVLDPQPRATKGGIRFAPDSRLMPDKNK
jgi:hypothetical protein